MKTCLDCIPCFLRQTLDVARRANAGQAKQEEILKEVNKMMADISLKVSPPEITRSIYALIREKTGVIDPFKEVKEKSNQQANNLYSILKKKVEDSNDKLLTSIELAIAGNAIDYGLKDSLEINKEIEKILNYHSCLFNDYKTIFNYLEFKEALNKAKTILYIADNAGEILFDKILIEELNKEVIFAVKGKPIINDALMEDAYACGLDKCSQLVSSGCDAPGTILKFCSKEFLAIYQDADLVVSKGQGNFETLSEDSRSIFFLFKVKCPVVAKDIKCKMGDLVLKKSS
ncbi:DUF89 family protein [bacterium]|nr:DUF89 family protein [bacterium]MBU0900208.1 DUF89 family protein [bacterium]MBU1152410.1 DUF89 family protein [bacterium]MBU1782316.1 DUF89 family protein [bacterium]